MNKIANMNLAYHRYPFEYFLDSTVRLNLDAIEIWAGEPHLYVPDATHNQVKSMLREIKKRKLNTICFTPEQCSYPINLSAKDTNFRNRSIDYFEKSIKMANSLECSMVLITAGYGHFSEPKEDAWERGMESLRDIASTAEKEGVILALEPFFFPYSNVIIDLETTKKMILEVNSPSLKPMIDTPCMVLANDTLDEYLSTFGDDLIHIHFVDGEGKTSAHLPWGQGNFPLSLFMESLNRADYTGYLTLELFGLQYNVNPEKHIRECLTYINSN